MGPGGPEPFSKTLEVEADTAPSGIPEVLEKPEINPLRYIELPPEERPLLFSMTPGVIKRSIPIDRHGLRPEFQVLTQRTPAQEELLKRMNVKKLPSGIFRFSESESSALRVMPVGFLMEGEKIAELVSYEVQKKQRGLPETTEYSPINLSFNELLQSIGQDGMNVFNTEEQKILRDLELVLLENNGLGIVDTIRILNDGGKTQSMRVRTESHTEDILNILGLPPEQSEVVEKVLAGINKSIMENGPETASTGSDLWSGKFVFVSSLEEPWKITPYSSQVKLSEEYMIDLIKTNLELALKFGERPYNAEDLRRVFRITDSKSLLKLASQRIPQELWAQRERVNVASPQDIANYLIDHGVTTQQELTKIFNCDQTTISLRWPDVLKSLPPELREEIESRKTGFSIPENHVRNTVERNKKAQDTLLAAKEYLIANPQILRLPKEQIFEILQEHTPIGMKPLNILLNHDTEISPEYTGGVYEMQVARGIENRSMQRKVKGVTFAGQKFDSAAEALTGFLIMNYTINDTLLEGENFQVNGQFDFRIKTKDGKDVIVEYHPEAMESIRDSNNQAYYSQRKEAQKKYGIEDTEVIVFDGFSSLESAGELMRFIQNNLRLSKSLIQGVQVDSEYNVSRLLNLARNGRGPYVPKDTYIDGNGRERYKYWGKPNAAIRYVLNHPEVLKKYCPDITLEDMVFFFRDHLTYSDEHKTKVEEIIRSYPEKTPLQVGEYILDDRDMNQSDRKAPLPKAQATK
jgi:hypothetical protein